MRPSPLPHPAARRRRPSRRGLLQAAAAAGLLPAGLLPGSARGAGPAVSAADRRFVFVFVDGGWDLTRFFLDARSSESIDGEDAAEPATTGDLLWVDHPDRPSVRAFVQAWHQDLAILDGMLVRSISHDGCRALTFTGDLADSRTDWATRLAAADAGGFALPHLVLGSLAWPGPHAALTVRVGASRQLDGLLDGSILAAADQPAAPMAGSGQALVDDWLRKAGGQALLGSSSSTRQQRLADWLDAHDRGLQLQQLASGFSFDGGDSLASQASLAVDVLERGLARCISLAHPLRTTQQGWDTHSQNDSHQSPLFEELFAALDGLLAGLATTPGRVGATLLDETVVVVFSEMARTPWLTPSGGKDHWPYTSVMLLGAGVRGGARIGGYDALQYGMPIDRGTGQPDPDGEVPTVEDFGATLLALGGEDVPEDLPNGVVVEGLLG